MPSAHYNQPPSQPLSRFEQGSSGDAWFSGRNTITTKLRARLVEELTINPLYTKEHTKGGLRFAWGRYVECSQAIKRAKTISEAGNWPTEIPPFTEYLIVDIFIGKTTWYTSYVKIFEPVDTVSDFVDMKTWLDDEEPQQQETEDVWGTYQSSYTIEDLRSWVTNGGSLPKKKRSLTPEDHSKGKQRVHRRKNL
jgi:hypothetical protein